MFYLSEKRIKGHVGKMDRDIVIISYNKIHLIFQINLNLDKYRLYMYINQVIPVYYSSCNKGKISPIQLIADRHSV
jgi:hypothetical protein